MPIVIGNLLQVGIVIASLALLSVAANVGTTNAVLAIVLMASSWLGIFVSTHAIAHWVVGRLGGIRFVGYGIRGTERPDAYPPGVRQFMSALPFFTVITDRASMRQAAPVARALMFAAGVTGTSVCTVLFVSPVPTVQTAANAAGGAR